jgi:hypothetical protein
MWGENEQAIGEKFEVAIKNLHGSVCHQGGDGLRLRLQAGGD